MKISELIEGIHQGKTLSIAKAITLLESDNPKDIPQKLSLLKQVKKKDCIKIGISGIPGVGKSSFIDLLGHYLCTTLNKKIAVITIDPSSTISGGSILGDQTRMPNLSQNKNAFIRSSPSKGALGGLNHSTLSVLSLLESSGFDYIIIETLGVGQSETQVSQMVDFMLYLSIPSTGDEIQGIKKGIMETVDGIVISKTDLFSSSQINSAKAHLMEAFGLLEMHTTAPKESIAIMDFSIKEPPSVKTIWDTLIDSINNRLSNGSFQQRRNHQKQLQFDKMLENELIKQLFSEKKIQSFLQQKKDALNNHNVCIPEIAMETAMEFMVKFLK